MSTEPRLAEQESHGEIIAGNAFWITMVGAVAYIAACLYVWYV